MTTISVVNSPINVAVTQDSGRVVVVQAQPVHVVTATTVGMQGPVGIVANMITVPASVGGHRVITAAGLYPNSTTLDLIVGVTTGAATAGQSVTYVASGAMDETGWNWIPNTAIYAGIDGVMTQIEPVGTFRRIATAVTANRIVVDLQPTIHRS